MNFTYKNPTLIEFGKGKIANLKTLIPKDRTILFLYGGGSIKRNGIYEQVINALQNHNFVEFGGVEPNPTKETLDKAVLFARENNVDFILAVGGGSVIDGSKYIASAFYYDGDGWDILENKYIPTKALGIGAVLTLAATGSESNSGAVITKKETKEKRFFGSPYTYPSFAVLDPDVLKSLDDRQIVNGLIDSFVHVCEQYLTTNHGCLVQDRYSEALLLAILKLMHTVDKKDDLWYANLMWSANQALNGLIGSGVPQDWATHFIGHELSGLYGIDHARTLAIIQPNLFRELLDEKSQKLLQMGKNVFGMQTDDANKVINKIESLYLSLGVNLKLSSYTDDKDVAQKVTELLHKHGFDRFGINGSINKDVVEKIIKRSL
ncbi:iron-containing alcohol dehydrogenase [Campylobacter pinnipediorum]|uniref:iron-containing alcohol dehydrogenase n=1 Tax=Campylobacter pinnipediorum TaxID=1965231 RepID=UPI00084D694D|nr:iron-containing alcohol dehydrogenase [Campylobacter pinnipediorum]OPA74547.1 aldehyde reductase [Campylobacter pinnipediorum subsp. pinnipediorum]